MSIWHATKAKRVYGALIRIGWTLKKQVGSHRKLQRMGPAALTRIAKDTGLRPEDL